MRNKAELNELRLIRVLTVIKGTKHGTICIGQTDRDRMKHRFTKGFLGNSNFKYMKIYKFGTLWF